MRVYMCGIFIQRYLTEKSTPIHRSDYICKTTLLHSYIHSAFIELHTNDFSEPPKHMYISGIELKSTRKSVVYNDRIYVGDHRGLQYHQKDMKPLYITYITYTYHITYCRVVHIALLRCCSPAIADVLLTYRPCHVAHLPLLPCCLPTIVTMLFTYHRCHVDLLLLLPFCSPTD